MAKINLRDLFTAYELDCYIEVPDEDIDAFRACLTKEIADVYIAFERAEVAYLRRLFWNKAHYSLDQGDGIENAALSAAIDPAAEYDRKITERQLYIALASLPEKQAERVFVHFILGVSKSAIARKEGVHKSQITRSIKKGLHGLKIFFEKSAL